MHTPHSTIATCMYYTGLDPFTKQEVYVSNGLRDRKLQRALMQFFKPENYFTVREALSKAGRADLISSGCDCLIPAQPPKEALEARRRRANEAARVMTITIPWQTRRRVSRSANRPAESGLPSRTNDSAPPGQETQAQGRVNPMPLTTTRPPAQVDATDSSGTLPA